MLAWQQYWPNSRDARGKYLKIIVVRTHRGARQRNVLGNKRTATRVMQDTSFDIKDMAGVT